MKERGFVSTKITVLVFSFLASILTFIGNAVISLRSSVSAATIIACIYGFLQFCFYNLWIIYLFVSKNSFKRSVLLSLAFACLVTEGFLGCIGLIGQGIRMEYVLQTFLSSYLIPFTVDLLVMIFSFVGIRRKGFITALFADVFFSIGNAFIVILTSIIYGMSGKNLINGLSTLFLDVALLLFAIHMIPRETAAVPAPVSAPVYAPESVAAEPAPAPVAAEPAPAAFCTNCGTRLAEGAVFCTGCGKKVE